MKFNSIIETDVSEMVVCLPIFFFGRCATLWSTQSSKMVLSNFLGIVLERKSARKGNGQPTALCPGRDYVQG